MNQHTTGHGFSKEEGLEIQAEQLAEWKLKLNKECYKALELWLKEKNKNLTRHSTLHQVMRGVDMDNFIKNWKPEFSTKAYVKIGNLATNHLGSYGARRMVALIKNRFDERCKYHWSLKKAVRECIKNQEDLDDFLTIFHQLEKKGRLLHHVTGCTEKYSDK
jgi:hypothetical protein